MLKELFEIFFMQYLYPHPSLCSSKHFLSIDVFPTLQRKKLRLREPFFFQIQHLPHGCWLGPPRLGALVPLELKP
jgi:hypothetical protein